MMDTPSNPVFFTRLLENGIGDSGRGMLHSNGTYTGNFDWKPVESVPKGSIWIEHSNSRTGLSFNTFFTDPVLAERIIQYFDDYFWNYNTNCSAFACFLTTGKFFDCENIPHNLVATEFMQPYARVKKVAVGDMLYLIGAPTFLKSPKLPIHNKLIKSMEKHQRQFCWRDGPGKINSLKKPVLSSDKIRQICETLQWPEYHCMVCIGVHDGKPVWLGQNGFAQAKKDQGFVVTVGEEFAFSESVVLFALIKRRKKQ